MAARNLLFISPVMPAASGNGLAMRAGVMLEALAADYDVHLLVIPVAGPGAGRGGERWASRWCARMVVHDVADRVDPLFRLVSRMKAPRERDVAYARYPRPLLCRFTSGAVRESAEHFQAVRFDEVHVFRLYMTPFAEPYLGRPSPTVRLDLDDHESRTRRALAALHTAAGDLGAAAVERAEAGKYARLERQALSRFHRVYVCSEDDRRVLGRHIGSRRVVVIPNAVRIPSARAAGRSRGPFTFLFVGTLGYYPNEDAAMFFCTKILPRLQATGQPVRVTIAGSNPSPRVRALGRKSGVTVAGAVPDLGALYRAAGAVVVPVRAGGGTRIKVLEAFAYRRPVVATTVGARGIEATNGTHLLIGDTPDAFAEHCRRLMTTPSVGRALAARAWKVVTARYTLERVRERLRQDHRQP